MHRVFHTPELRLYIFEQVGRQSEVACALVCKEWYEVMANRLWKSLDSPKPLVSLLGRLQKDVNVRRLSIYSRQFMTIRFTDRMAEVQGTDWSSRLDRVQTVRVPCAQSGHRTRESWLRSDGIPSHPPL